MKSKRWTKFGTVTREDGTEYTTWQDLDGVFNISPTGHIPREESNGYADLCHMMKVYGLDVNRHRHGVDGL